MDHQYAAAADFSLDRHCDGIGMEGVGVTLEELKAERDRLKKRLEWLGVRSSGSERLERQIHRLEREIAQRGSQSA